MQHIGVQGVGLQPPTALYPNQVNSRPGVVAAGAQSLAPGANALIPAGEYLVAAGLYSVVQVLDPVSGLWRPIDPANPNGPTIVNSDGENYRVYNPLGFPVAAVITNHGTTDYTSAPTVAASTGGSTWTAVVGGAVSAINLTSGGGSGFSVPPAVCIAPPASPGIQATAVATVNSAGSVVTLTMVNNGAGYGTTAPAVVLVPQINDLTTTSIRVPAATTQLSFVGKVTAVILTNEGNNPLAAAPALTFSGGGGGGAAATAVNVNTVVSFTASAGSGLGAVGTQTGITSIGGSIMAQSSGIPQIGSALNPFVTQSMVVPRQMNAVATILVNGVSGVPANSANIIDGGLFTALPILYAAGPRTSAAASPTNDPTLTPTLGYVNDTVWLQPL